MPSWAHRGMWRRKGRGIQQRIGKMSLCAEASWLNTAVQNWQSNSATVGPWDPFIFHRELNLDPGDGSKITSTKLAGQLGLDADLCFANEWNTACNEASLQMLYKMSCFKASFAAFAPLTRTWVVRIADYDCHRKLSTSALISLTAAKLLGTVHDQGDQMIRPSFFLICS